MNPIVFILLIIGVNAFLGSNKRKKKENKPEAFDLNDFKENVNEKVGKGYDFVLKNLESLDEKLETKSEVKEKEENLKEKDKLETREKDLRRREMNLEIREQKLRDKEAELISKEKSKKLRVDRGDFKEDLIKAVVFSEVLDKPKSLRK